MAKSSTRSKATPTVETSAMGIALSIQRPGQTKEQTKLIARGIEKGIAQYKKQQSAKARELDKNLKQLARAAAEPPVAEVRTQESVRYKQHWLPWTLLILTWLGAAGVALLR